MMKMLLVVFLAGWTSFGAAFAAVPPASTDSTSATLQRMTNEKRPPAELIAYLKSNIHSLPETQRDGLVNALIACQKTRYNDFARGFEFSEKDAMKPGYRATPENLNLIVGIKDEELRGKLTQIRRNGYLCSYTEDIPYIDLDFRAILNTFRDDLSDELKEFLLIQAREAEDKAYDDGSGRISYDELASRLGMVSEFRKHFPASAYNPRVRLYWELYLQLYLEGARSMPAFDTRGDETTATIHEDLMSSYRTVKDRWKETEFGDLIGKYLALLEKSQGRRTAEIGRFIHEHAPLGQILVQKIYTSACFWNIREDLDSTSATVPQ